MARKKQPAKRTTNTYARSKHQKGTNARKSFVLLVLLLVAGLIIFGIYKTVVFTGSLFFSRNPNFEITNIDITTDGRLSPVQLREYADVEEGENLFAVHFKTVRKNLEEKVSLVKSVQIRRNLPHTLVLDVIERVPVAQIRWDPRGMPFLMDDSGIVLPPTRSGQALPLIKGVTLERLRPGDVIDDSGVMHCLALLSATEQLGVGIQLPFESFDLRYPEFITANLTFGTSARFPRHSAKQKIIRLVSVLQLAREQGRRIKTVDLTPDGRNVPVTYY